MDKNKAKETVLIARFSALGDVVMTIPPIYSTCRAYPAVRFVVLTKPSCTALFVNAPANLEVVGLDVKNEYKGIGGIRQLASHLIHKYHPVAYIDLHAVLRTVALGAFLRFRGVTVRTLRKGYAQRKGLTRARNKNMEPLVSQRFRYRDTIRRAGYGAKASFEGLYDGHARAAAEDFAAISTPKADGTLWIGIAPFSAHAGKIYPAEKMEQVVAMLQQYSDSTQPVKVFLFGAGASEQTVLDAWAAKYPCAVSLAGKRYGFKAELALMNHLDAMLSMDSANMHLAATVSTPVVSIWGATHPYAGFKAWRSEESDYIQLPLECRPCSIFGNKPCHKGDYPCLNGIEPVRVFNKLIERAKK